MTTPTGLRTGSELEPTTQPTTQQGGPVIPAKVFVGNLNYSTTAAELEEVFSQAGDVVEVLLPADRATGRPRGFGFVEFTDDDAVAEAIEKFDGYELGGRQLRVNEAGERPPRPPRMGGFSGGGRPPGPPPSKPKGSRRNLRGRKRSL